MTEPIAYVPIEEFNQLLEYSTSIPTGTTVGKRWKRDNNWHRKNGPDADWWLMEYVEDPDPKFVGIQASRIIVCHPPMERSTS